MTTEIASGGFGVDRDRGTTPDDARTLLARLLRGIAPEIDLDETDPATALTEAAELDSMDFLNLVDALYDETGIDVPERDYPQIATIDGFVAYVSAARPAHDPAR
jgi:acyl carrier protein